MSAVVVPPVGPLVRCAHTCSPGTRHELEWVLLAAITVGVVGLGGLLIAAIADAIWVRRRR